MMIFVLLHNSSSLEPCRENCGAYVPIVFGGVNKKEGRLSLLKEDLPCLLNRYSD